MFYVDILIKYKLLKDSSMPKRSLDLKYVKTNFGKMTEEGIY